MSEPVLTLLSQIEEELERMPGCKLVAAAPDARNGERVSEEMGRPLPAGAAAFFERYDGGSLGGSLGPDPATSPSSNTASSGRGARPRPMAMRTARLLSFEESRALRMRAGEALQGLWPILQRDGQMIALDADVDGDDQEWPVVQVADHSVDRLGTSLLRYLHVLCVELRFDAQGGSLVELARERRVRDPHLSEHWVDLADALTHAGLHDEAERVLTEGASSAEPVGPSLLAAIGLQTMLNGDTTRARVVLEDAVTSEPLTAHDDDARLDAAALLLLLGTDAGETELADRARGILKHATEATAGFWRAEAVRAMGAGDEKRAQLALRLLATLQPEDTDGPRLSASTSVGRAAAAELTRAREALDIADVQDAVRHARAAVGALPEVGLAHAVLAEALNASRSPEALEHAQTAVRLNPTLIDGWRELAEAWFEKRDLNETLKALDDGLARDRSYGLLHAKRAQVLLELGRRIEALDAISQAAEYGGDAFFVAAVRGDVLSAMERHSDAAHAYEQALLYEPEDHWVLHQTALEYSQAGEADRAAQLFELAIANDRDGCHQTLVDYAELMERVGRIGDAVRLYRRAVKAVPNEASWRQSLKEAEKQLAAAPN